MSAAVCKKAVPHGHRQPGSYGIGLEKSVLFANLLFAHIYRRPHKADSHAAARSPQLGPAPLPAPAAAFSRENPRSARGSGGRGPAADPAARAPAAHGPRAAGIGRRAHSGSPKVLQSDLGSPHALSPATTLTPPSHRQAQKRLPAAEDLLSPPRQNRSRRVSNRFLGRVRRGMPARSRL